MHLEHASGDEVELQHGRTDGHTDVDASTSRKSSNLPERTGAHGGFVASSLSETASSKPEQHPAACSEARKRAEACEGAPTISARVEVDPSATGNTEGAQIGAQGREWRLAAYREIAVADSRNTYPTKGAVQEALAETLAALDESRAEVEHLRQRLLVRYGELDAAQDALALSRQTTTNVMEALAASGTETAEAEARATAAEAVVASVAELADGWVTATCLDDGAPCSFHRQAPGYAAELRALLPKDAS